jgi:capsule polysaccharide export protein KpsC/LpsZ
MNSKDFCSKMKGRTLPKVAVSSAGWLNETNKYLPQLLRAKELIVPQNDNLAQECSAFVQWGILESDSKKRLRDYAANLNRPLVFIEDGFIRSLGIGLSQEPGRSIIMDDLGFYYDASKPTRLETILNSDEKFGWFKMRRARKAIALIVKNRISKYNDAPETLPAELAGPKTKHRILVIDQRDRDASITGALANETNFEKMIGHAFSNPEAEVVVKIHPDALMPGKSSAIYAGLKKYLKDSRLKIISRAVNPYTLFDAVDEVYTVASGMGFEAIMAGKPVACFGVPYYAGWGLTIDMVEVPRRVKMRSVEEVFYVAWIMLSRYVDPKTMRLCSVEDAAKRLAAERKAKNLTR